MNREVRVQMANQTLEIMREGCYSLANGERISIGAFIDACVSRTQLILPEESERMIENLNEESRRFATTEFEVKNETTISGAARLKGAHDRVGVLNFASARNPGGGYLNGSQAQEESLARSSALFKSLNQCKEFYDYHRQNDSLLYSDRIIVSPECLFFRDDEGTLRPPFQVDVLTCAAPNAGAIRKNQPDKAALIRSTIMTRAKKVLAVAVNHKMDSLVLGAWGCGVFKNSPEDVAEIFGKLLKTGGVFHGRFHKVLFSVLDFSENRQCFRAFEKTFK